ncbi:hypothetical protein GLAREA_00067 [Glarea lozoyensis ATCC 20868]|uniref:Nucleoside 2-deoxyribosyltransferase domain-containing protein n=1 Tax=Glarea lozoyensis (strain ATCC 20868 / MF5171) TaxID=1116229 RepID=S3CVC4_GLAL2|nr:uncharacterized protein GLAREA_00067 [Glarea lozoyensis ATCC 20868]EPE28909.1 hypothetical protein GLAREA_00067 [Glarea lozoyensis ATCC 20868]
MSSTIPPNIPPKATTIQAPTPLTSITQTPTIFLSGYISHPDACWRNHLTTALSHLPITILNPLRRDWDSTWKNSPSDPKFVEQTSWELECLERADLVVVNFGSLTSAPISLMEMGFALGMKKRVVVCCPEGYYYRGNVQVMCGRLGYEVFEGFEEFVGAVVRSMEGLVGKDALEE